MSQVLPPPRLNLYTDSSLLDDCKAILLLLPYPPQTWAPEVSKAEDAQGQHQENQPQNQGSSLVAPVHSLLFPHLHLRRTYELGSIFYPFTLQSGSCTYHTVL